MNNECKDSILSTFTILTCFKCSFCKTKRNNKRRDCSAWGKNERGLGRVGKPLGKFKKLLLE